MKISKNLLHYLKRNLTNLVSLPKTMVIVLITVLLSFISIPNVANSVTDSWTTSLHDVQRTSASSDTTFTTSNAANIVKKWSFKTGGPIASSPSVVNNTVFVGSWDGYEYALDATTGAQKWKTFLGITIANPICVPPSLGISSAATIVGNTVYVGGGDSYWYALNATTGAVLWKVFTGDNSAQSGHYNWSSPLIVGNYAYIGIASEGDCPLVQGQLLKVNLTTHQIEKTLNLVPDGQVGGGIWTSPSYDPATNTIFAATGTENSVTQIYAQAFVAIDATNMVVKDYWKLPESEAVLDSDFSTSPTLFTSSTGTPLVVSINKNGKAYAFNRNNLAGGPVWEQHIAIGGECPTCGESSVSSGAFGGGKIFLAGATTTITNKGYKGSVRALNPNDGAVLWEHGTTGSVIGALAYANQLVFSGSGSIVEVLNANNGARLYSYETGSDIFSAPSIANGTIFTGNLSGNIYAFGLPTVTPPPPPPDPNCPSGWVCQAIGSPIPAGSETVNSGNWSISAGGSGIGGTNDSFRYFSQNKSGNFQLIAKVNSFTPNGTDSQVGVMIRQNSDTSAPYYAVLVTPNNNLTVSSRNAFGGTTSTINTAGSGFLPKYIQIQRIGDQITTSTSTNGTSFTLVPGTTQTLVLPNQVRSGLVISSARNGFSASATLSNVSMGNISNTPAPSPSVNPCPSTWSCADIGNPIITGDQTLSNNIWTVKGAGGDIWAESDQFHYVWKSLTGDQTFSAQVLSQSGSDPFAKAGIMMRKDSSAESSYYAVYQTPGNGIQVQFRLSNGYTSEQLTTYAGNAPSYLRIARNGTTFTAYSSTDGINYIPVPDSTEDVGSLGGTVLGGLVVNSHNTGVLGTATFGSVNFINSAPTPPNICPSSWSCNDIGFPTPHGEQTLADGLWTVQAGGGDMWDTADQLRLVSQNLSADGGIKARIVSQSNSSDWAKAGVSLRKTTSIDSPYYGVLATPGHGFIIQYRLTAGGTTSQLSFNDSLPAYVQVTRVGSSYTAYTSTDGSTYTPVAGSTVNIISMNGSVLAGLTVVSHNPSQASTVTYDNVSVFETQASTCPSGWNCGDIGNPDIAGSTTFANNIFTVTGAGNDIWGTDDQFQFVSKDLTGDGEIIARVTSQTNSSEWAKAGVMIKQSATALAPYALLAVTPDHGIHLQANFNSDQGGTTYTFPNSWLKLKRVGNSITAFTSTDGSTWAQLGSVTVNLNTNAVIGLFVGSHNGQSASTATFDNVTINNSALPSPWVNEDIGSPELAGSTAFVNNTFTVNGAGNDIWADADQFQYVHQSISGDATIIAKINSQTNSSDWAKAGIMIKQSTTVGAPYVLLATTPLNGLVTQSNFNSSQSLGTYNFPQWLKLTKVGNTFTSYTSTNGTNWTEVGTTNLTMTTNATIGLFVNSHNGGQVSTAIFDSVNVSQP